MDTSNDLIFEFYKMADDHPLLSVVSEDDIALLSLRLKEETMINHLSSDLEMAEVLMKYLPVKKVKADVITSALHSVYFTMVHLKETENENIDEILILIIKGIMMQIIE